MQFDDADFRTRRGLSDEPSLVRFGELSASGDKDEEAAFLALVAPLEERVGRKLTGAGRQACIHAFRTHPAGFARLCSDAMARGSINPLGLLIVMVRAGEHKLDPCKASGGGSAAKPACFTLLVLRDDGVTREMFSDPETCERRAAELARELGAHNVTKVAA